MVDQKHPEDELEPLETGENAAEAVENTAESATEAEQPAEVDEQVITASQEAEVGKDLETLIKEHNEALAKAAEYLDGWQRSRAEFANYKKRIDREQAQVYQNAAGNIIKRYIDVLDDLERALKNRPKAGDGVAWAEGIELIYRKLKSILESEGVTPMNSEGQFFDPMMHEAVTSEDNDDYESGQIIEVLQQGYMIGDRVLRPAMVRVAR